MFIEPKPLNIVATILAKNEEDIIGTTIEHHIKIGISKFIVTDNNSTDKTKSIIEKYPEVVEIIDEPDDTHNQSKHVTRMARLACKLNPDWIVHLDADELWGGFEHLGKFNCDVVGSESMFLHPPTGVFFFGVNHMTHYLDFSGTYLPEECKIIHRPNPDIEIEHGNHGVVGKTSFPTKLIYRHHYPLRSLPQFENKAAGHLALKKRNAICKRWEKWHAMKKESAWKELTAAWETMIKNPNRKTLRSLLEYWSTDEVINYYRKNDSIMPLVKEWKP